MPLDDSYLDELRLMFMEGATVSRLIHHIARRNSEETSLFQMVQESFFRAFGVGPLQISRKRDLSDLDEDTSYFLNEFLIADIIGHYPEWGRHLASQAEPFWKDLDPKSSFQYLAEVHPEDVPELADSWDRLDSAAQNYIRRTLGNLSEVMRNLEILARLSERLQRQIVEQPIGPAHAKE